jgi:hypothetical protein
MLLKDTVARNEQLQSEMVDKDNEIQRLKTELQELNGELALKRVDELNEAMSITTSTSEDQFSQAEGGINKIMKEDEMSFKPDLSTLRSKRKRCFSEDDDDELPSLELAHNHSIIVLSSDDEDNGDDDEKPNHIDVNQHDAEKIDVLKLQVEIKRLMDQLGMNQRAVAYDASVPPITIKSLFYSSQPWGMLTEDMKSHYRKLYAWYIQNENKFMAMKDEDRARSKRTRLTHKFSNNASVDMFDWTVTPELLQAFTSNCVE